MLVYIALHCIAQEQEEEERKKKLRQAEEDKKKAEEEAKLEKERQVSRRFRRLIEMSCARCTIKVAFLFCRASAWTASPGGLPLA